MPPVTEASVEFTSTWSPLRSALYRVARPAGSTTEYTQQWIVSEGKAGRIRAQGRTYDGQEAWLLPSAWESIDCAAGTLRLTRARKERLIRLRDWRGELVPDILFSDPAIIVQPHGTLGVWPPRAPDNFQEELRAWRGITAEANEIGRLYPVLISAAEWMRKAVERYADAGTAGAERANLNALIELETNRDDWARFVELADSIGGHPDNSVLEETARALLVSDLSSAYVPEIQPILREMQECKRRMVDRFTKAVHAGQLEITGYSVSNLMELVTIPARFVTADQILSLLRSGELSIFDQRYVGARIGPPESSEVSSESQHAVGPSGQQAGQPSAKLPPGRAGPAKSDLDEPTPEAASTNAEQPDQPQTIVPFRSGGQGRPTAVDTVIAEGKRRIEMGEVTPMRNGLTKFATTLRDWWKVERQTYTPIAPSIGVTTICNGLRDLWNSKLPPQTPLDR
jgi:hypothetical protein